MESTLMQIITDNASKCFSSFRFPYHVYRSVVRYSKCRTMEMGGHYYKCPKCHTDGAYYNSCKTRGCPRCMNVGKKKWLDKALRRLLPTDHFHIVLTIPNEFNDLYLHNRFIFNEMLFSCAKESLDHFLLDKKWMGAEPGIIMNLHTWSLSINPTSPSAHISIGMRINKKR